MLYNVTINNNIGDNYEIYPSIVKEIVKNPDKKYHKVDNS